jgi:peptidoglycan/LPS O-acetylase OafA/YrhL
MQFYLLLPIVCLIAMFLFRSHRGHVAMIACIVGMLIIGIASRFIECHYLAGYYAAIGNQDGVRFRSTFAYLDLFAFGMAVTAVQLLDPDSPIAQFLQRSVARAFLIVMGIALFVAGNDWCAAATGGVWQGQGSTLFLTCFPVLICGGLALLLLSIVTSPFQGPIWLRSGPLRWLGVISYSLYLYHTGVQYFIFKLRLFHAHTYNVMTVGNALVSFLPAVAVASLFFFVVERPSLKLVARVRDRDGKSPSQTDPRAAAGDPAATALQPISLLAP